MTYILVVVVVVLLLLLLLLLCVCRMIFYVATKDTRWARCSWPRGPRRRPPTASYNSLKKAAERRGDGVRASWLYSEFRSPTRRSLLVHLCLPRTATASVPVSPQ